MKKERLSNFELLRIVAMLGIVLFHSLCHGNYTTDSYSLNDLFTKYFQFTGEVGVDIFVIITGYFVGGGKSIILT